MIRLLSFGLLASVAFVAPAAADIRTDCKKDVETFCKSVKPGGGKLKPIEDAPGAYVLARG